MSERIRRNAKFSAYFAPWRAVAANIAVFSVKECIVFLKYITKPEPVTYSAAGSGLLFAVFVSLL